MFMLIAMTMIGIIYNIYTANNPEKPYLCPTCGQPTEKKHERYIFDLLIMAIIFYAITIIVYHYGPNQ